MTEIKRNLKVYEEIAINQQNNQLSSAYLGKFIAVVKLDIDRYSRTVAKVYLDKLYVNAVMVKTDYDWLYRKYGKDLSLCDLKNEAAYSSSA